MNYHNRCYNQKVPGSSVYSKPGRCRTDRVLRPGGRTAPVRDLKKNLASCRNQVSAGSSARRSSARAAPPRTVSRKPVWPVTTTGSSTPSVPDSDSASQSSAVHQDDPAAQGACRTTPWAPSMLVMPAIRPAGAGSRWPCHGKSEERAGGNAGEDDRGPGHGHVGVAVEEIEAEDEAGDAAERQRAMRRRLDVEHEQYHREDHEGEARPVGVDRAER